MKENSSLSIDEVMNRIKNTMINVLEVGFSDDKKTTCPTGNGKGIEAKLNEMDIEIRQNNINWNVTNDFIITSHRKYIGKFIVFSKKNVRKILKWYINPPWEKQRGFNGSATRAINVLGELTHSQINSMNNIIISQINHSNEINYINNTLTDIQATIMDEVSRQLTGLEARFIGLQDELSNTNNETFTQISDLQSILTTLGSQLSEQQAQIAKSYNAFVGMSKMCIFFFADKNPDLAIAMAVELIRLSGDEQFINLYKQLNERRVNMEINS